MTKKCILRQPKFALAEFDIQLINSMFLQYQSQMLLMFFSVLE
jgi:hypothetical protein